MIFWRQDKTLNARAVELKAGKVRTKDALAQLQAGATVIETLTVGEAGVAFVAILAQRKFSTLDRRLLARTPIRFREDARLVRVVRCGAQCE
jgi:hypothetical protein